MMETRCTVALEEEEDEEQEEEREGLLLLGLHTGRQQWTIDDRNCDPTADPC